MPEVSESGKDKSVRVPHWLVQAAGNQLLMVGSRLAVGAVVLIAAFGIRQINGIEGRLDGVTEGQAAMAQLQTETATAVALALQELENKINFAVLSQLGRLRSQVDTLASAAEVAELRSDVDNLQEQVARLREDVARLQGSGNQTLTIERGTP